MYFAAGLTLNKMNDYDEDDAFKLTVAVLNIITWFSLVSLPIIQVISSQLYKVLHMQIQTLVNVAFFENALKLPRNSVCNLYIYMIQKLDLDTKL